VIPLLYDVFERKLSRSQEKGPSRAAEPGRRRAADLVDVHAADGPADDEALDL
jgi:hypothetical protein